MEVITGIGLQAFDDDGGLQITSVATLRTSREFMGLVFMPMLMCSELHWRLETLRF